MSDGGRRVRLHVGPRDDDLIRAAATDAGATLVAPEEAEAIVWLGEPEELRPRLHPGVRWVQLPSAGVEGWLRAGVVDAERVWTSAAGAYAGSAAEHALALILALARRLPECARADAWDPGLTGRPLSGSTVAVVGAGGIGRALIALLAPLGVRVLAVTRTGREVPGAEESLPAERLAEVWPQADVVVVAAPATAATRHLVDRAALRALPGHALLVNVARGSLVDTDALIAALAAGEVAGAALDVTDPEPLPRGHPLWREPRALVTPHTANPPAALGPELAARVADNVARFAAGRPLEGVIDLERAY